MTPRGTSGLPATAASLTARVELNDPSVKASAPVAEPIGRPASPEPLIELRYTTVRFGECIAIKQLNLTLQRGERLALVGANGSGKTTLLRLLHGLVAPTEGERLLQGAPVMAMVFQHTFLLNLSVRWNLRIALWLRGLRWRDHSALVTEGLQRVGLGGQARRRARDLSGGQQQRLALARAWVLRPDLLFLDEPTASLDPSAKREVEALIESFTAEGMTVVMSTHNLGQAKRLASRVIYLEAGRLIVDRPVDRFFQDPDLPIEAQQFLRGELPWNN